MFWDPQSYSISNTKKNCHKRGSITVIYKSTTIVITITSPVYKNGGKTD